MNSPVWAGIFELDFGTDISTTFAMVGRIEEHPQEVLVASATDSEPDLIRGDNTLDLEIIPSILDSAMIRTTSSKMGRNNRHPFLLS